MMAISIDLLIRSIESELIDESEREKVRDLFARIDGVRDAVRPSSLSLPRFEMIELTRRK